MPSTQPKSALKKISAKAPSAVISVRVPADLLQQAEAAAGDASMTDFVREMLVRHLTSSSKNRNLQAAPEPNPGPNPEPNLGPEIARLATGISQVEKLVHKTSGMQSAEFDRMRKQLQLQATLLRVMAKPLGLAGDPFFQALDKQIQASLADSKKGGAA